MIHWLTERHTVTLLNVFTRSRYAPYSDAAFVHENDELSYVSAMRLREDELFLRRIKECLPKGLKNNLNMHDLNLKDAPIRLRVPINQVCNTPVNSADPSLEKIRRALARQAELGTMEAVVIPSGVGSDVDHVTVREAAMPFTASLPTAFYEDLPYLATHPSATADLETLKSAATERNDALVEIVCHPGEPAADAIVRKRKLVLNYASQIDDEAGVVISNFATHYGGGERLWANKLWQSSFA
jgi:nucleotide-binding universal stress UspA family protein